MIKKYIFPFFFWLATINYTIAQVDRTKVPVASPAPIIQIGEASKFELSNGLKVFVVENHRIPRVTYSLSFIFDPPLEGDFTGLADLTGDLIGTGTATRTKDQINEDIDFMGASLSGTGEGIYASSLKKHSEKLLEIFSDVAMHSVFNQEELEKKRTQILSELASDKDDPKTIAANVFSALIYGKKHPYGEFETEQTVKQITLDMCTNYYKTWFKPNIAYLTVIGDITPAEAKSIISTYFGNWQKGETIPFHYPQPQVPPFRRVALVDRPQSVQSVIQLGYPVELNVSNPDYIKAIVMNTILGGSNNRLFLNLREKHAYTYGAYSKFSFHPLISNFNVSTNVRNVVTDSSITQIIYEMNRLRDEPVPAKELALVKNYMTGNFALSLENPRTIASFAVNIERYKLPANFYIDYLKNLEKVSVADVQQMAKKYINADQSIILVVGKSSMIADKIARFGHSGKVEQYDIYADLIDTSKLMETMPSGVTPQVVLDQYIKAIGGIEKIEKIKDIIIKAIVNYQGNMLNFNLSYKIPGKFKSEVFMNGQVVQKNVLSDDKAKVSDMQGIREAQGAELEKIKMDGALFPELSYSKMGYVVKLTGLVTVDSTKAYQLEITSPLGNSTVDYFSVSSGLKIKSVSTLSTPQGQLTQSTTFSNYTDYNGIKFPGKMNQRMGPQVFEITLDGVSVNTGLEDFLFQ